MESCIVIQDMGEAVSITTASISAMAAVNQLLNAIDSITRDSDLPPAHVAAMLRGCALLMEM